MRTQYRIVRSKSVLTNEKGIVVVKPGDWVSIPIDIMDDLSTESPLDGAMRARKAFISKRSE